jgi:hypothetical protein
MPKQSPIMNETKYQTEQRKSKRISGYDGASVVLTHGSSSMMGLITDISKGGLAFRYLDQKTNHQEEPADYAELSVLWKTEGIEIENLHCKIIEDYDASPEYSFSLVPMRKCRVEFVDLTPEQEARLDKLIEQFAGRVAQNV